MELKTKINKFLKFTSLCCLIVTLNNQEFLVVVFFFGEIVILVVIGSNFNTFKFNVTNKHN